MTAADTSVEVLPQTGCCVVDISQEDGVHYGSIEQQSDGVGPGVVQSDVDPVIRIACGFSLLDLEHYFVGWL